MQRRPSILASFLLVTATLTPVWAAQGRTPIFEPDTVIAADGSYFVTHNLAGTGQPIITIAAENVILDLNGFVLSAPYNAPLIRIAGGFAPHVTIRNGRLAFGLKGIEALGVVHELTLEDLHIRDPAEEGILLGNVESLAVRRVEIRNAGTDGLLWNGTQTKHGTIEDSLVRDCQGGGIVIRFACLSVAVTGNRVEGTSGHGIELNQCRGSSITNNTVALGFATGIRLTQSWGNTITGNAVSEMFGNGIHLDVDSSSNLVQGNTSTRSGGFNDWALRVDGQLNRIEGNVLNENWAGLLFSATGCGNTFTRNTARGNQGFGAVCGTSFALFPPNSCDISAGCTFPNSSLGDNLIPGPPPF